MKSVSVAALVLGVCSVVVHAEPSEKERAEFFDAKVLPLLREYCLDCHGEQKQKGELRLDTYAGLMAGGELGAVVVPGKPDESLLIKAVRYTEDELRMPPKKRLSPEQVAVLEEWVKGGVTWPGAEKAEAPVPVKKKVKEITAKDREYWAYRKVVSPKVPVVATPRAANEIDSFVVSKLKAAGLKPNPPATKRELIRRVYYDVIGLPPSPEDVAVFESDESPEAYEQLVDKLLASDQYGEKWGRHWLDVVRYAETNGYERDGTKPQAWRYRDYVIQSLNADKPYDQFVREQVTGDSVTPADGQAIIATGFYRLGIWDDEPADAQQALFDGYDDIVTVVSQGFLGMTVNCARCHDHKVDPILQSDYYRMLAFFRDIRPYSDTRDVASRFNLTDIFDVTRTAEEKAKLRALDDRKDKARAEMYAVEQAAIKKMPAEDQRASEGNDRPKVLAKLDPFFDEAQRKEYAALKAEIKGLDEKLNVPKDLALSVNHSDVTPPPTHVLIRGSAHAPGDVVEPGYPTVLGFAEPKIPAPPAEARNSGRRAVLADWLVSRDNPLTSRVMMNRLWQHHFGRGIVRSSNDFGGLGDKPTHPELLDWLAARFMEGGWRLKPMHKLILMSNTYRMSSAESAAAALKDPTNDLLWRFDPRRLTAEELRDSILAVNGSLNPQMGGPSIFTDIPQVVLQGASMPNAAWGKSPPDQQRRRSVYIFVKRSVSDPALATFDAADTDSSCPVRFVTTVPTQALTMLNSKFTGDQAAVFAARLKKEAGADAASRVKLGLRLVTTREPTEAETARGVKLMQQWRELDGMSEDKALETFCLMALNLNEFIYLD